MNSKLTKRINIAALLFVLLVIIAAVFLRKQTVSYDLVGNKDTSITLDAGETVMQTYSPNRRAITEFVFRLSEETSLDGTYTLIVTDKETPEEEPLLTISNEYDGETTDALVFRTSQKYDPKPSIRLNLFIQSDAGNQGSIELASCSALRSASYYDEAKGELTLSDSTLALTIVSEKNYKWFFLMYILLITMGTTFIFNHVFKSSFEDNVALGIMAAVLFAYFLGVIGLLKFAPAALFIVALAGVVLYFLDCIKKEVPFYKGISFGMILWVAVVLVLFVTVHHNIIGDPDSAFHINKARYMFWTDSLAFNSVYFFFIHVFAFILEKVNGIFTEDIFLLSIMIYIFSLLFAFFTVVKTKDIKKNIALETILMGLCTILAIAILPSAFFTAMMDIPFAITVAYIVKQLYVRDFKREILFKIICASLVLVMIKRSGFPVIIIFAFIMMIHAFRYNKMEKKCDKRYLIGILLIFFTCFFATKAINFCGSKTTYMVDFDSSKNYHYSPSQNIEGEEASDSGDSMVQASAIDDSTDSTVETSKIAKMIRGFDTKSVGILLYAFFSVNVILGLSYAEVLGVLFILGAIIWLIKKDKYSLNYFVDMVELITASGLYYGAIAYKYMYSIEDYNRYNLNAYDRYAIHFLGAVIIFATLSLLRIFENDSDEKNSDLKLVLIASVVLIAISFRVDFGNTTSWIDSDMVAIEDKTDELERVMATYYGAEHRIALYTSAGSFDRLDYYTKRVNLENWNISVSYNGDDITSKEMLDAYIVYLDRFDYLYLVNYDNSFLNCCSNLFENGKDDIRRHALYYVDKKDNGIVNLVYLGQIPMEDTILRTPDGKAKLGD